MAPVAGTDPLSKDKPVATAEVPPQVVFYTETLKALREDLHASRKMRREEMELLRDLRDLGPLLKDIHDEMVLAREARERRAKQRRKTIRETSEDRRKTLRRRA